MSNEQKIAEFLKVKNIAVCGISRNTQSIGNFIYKKFKDAGYNVYGVNPMTDEIEGVKCYRALNSLPVKPEGVFMTTHPAQSLAVVKECAELGIKKVWFHHSFGQGSYSKEAEEFCKKNNIEAITFGCPMMYVAPVDFGHKCFKYIFKWMGKLN